MINIVIPMAGKGKRYSEKGYDLPKPLINVIGKPMIVRVIENLMPKEEHRFIFVVRQEHIEKYGIDKLLITHAPGCIIIAIRNDTEGQASSVLLAKEYINNEQPLMIANCDQYVDIDINDYLHFMFDKNADGLIMTLTAINPEWSYVKLDKNGLVCETVEKEVVSEHATVGIFNFKHGRDYIFAAEEMIKKDIRVNGEFYVAPVYNELLKRDAVVYPYDIGSVGNGMYGMGTPKELELLLEKYPTIFKEPKNE